ncbi:hypothetical protein ANCCEY_02926 [Ancylostoma ceylanicum]|uniref:Peptidase M1 membrane alanine aminopeptidase domain-containing protein n=1 Tax=Ancylostoma ceylanicum TaxID=53326 RepID=A0A0D6MBU2_9BILA|nr:hypothetical protein ANCCEY_02926 [Ancylostoma ceylanicum]
MSTFEETPIMSSYLLAILVSEFTFDESKTRRGVRFRVWSSPDNKDKRGFALKASVKFMETFEKYFGINDVLKKQDLVAVPQFGSGAMENWGLTTYSSPDLPEVLLFAGIFYTFCSSPDLPDVLLFADGDLELVGRVHPNMMGIYCRPLQHKDLFVHGNDASMRKDSLAASRPLSSIVDIATEIPEAFDKISYGKGGSILAMMRDVVGEQNFRKAIINYLKKFSFKTASTEDMWKAFDETIDHVKGPTGAKLNMLDFGNQWSKQMGFPLVTIESFNSSAVKLTQERYMLYPSALPLKKYRSPIYRYKWDIPLWYEKKGKLHQVWLTRDDVADEPLYLEVDQAVPINVNVDRRGYFRQNYDTAGWQKIIVQFKNDHEVYSGWTRHGVISDAFAAALIDRLDYLTLFELLSYLPKEKLYVLKLLEKPYQKSLAQYISGEVTRNGVQMFRVVGNTEEHRDGHSKQMTEAPGSSDLSDP